MRRNRSQLCKETHLCSIRKPHKFIGFSEWTWMDSCLSLSSDHRKWGTHCLCLSLRRNFSNWVVNSGRITATMPFSSPGPRLQEIVCTCNELLGTSLILQHYRYLLCPLTHPLNCCNRLLPTPYLKPHLWLFVPPPQRFFQHLENFPVH